MRPWPLPPVDAAPVGFRRGTSLVVAAEPAEVVAASGAAALDAVGHLTPGWWAGYVSYDLGRAVEPIAERRPAEPNLPDLLLARYEARAVLGPDGTRYEGERRARQRLERLVDSAVAPRPAALEGRPTSSLDRAEYEDRVRTILALLEAGDCYQVNLTRRITWRSEADPVGLGHAVRTASPAPHESTLVLPSPNGASIGVVSASPECFLTWSGDRVETRPIKGTAKTATSLRASTKDRAENVMIVDLARNDLGRCCGYGSVAAPAVCEVEAHPGLFHLVSTVRGRRRPGVGPAELLRAAFPPASVTGAPKPRVLQVIEDLEPCRRGVYCGAVGWLDTERDEGDLAVAIRTFTVVDGETRLGTGAGIVADSDPSREWEETELKVARLTSAAAAPPTAPARPRRATPAGAR
jgi:para-aminobenzoate synthetase component I